MADDEFTADLPEAQPPADGPAELPERLRVHSLARVLGTTSKRVLDALRELDGRSRSAHSSINQADAVRVRELLAEAESEAAAVEVAVPADTDSDGLIETGAEPESRLILETPEPPAPPSAAVVEPAAYMPLFVAPQPIVVEPDADAEADTDEVETPEPGAEDEEEGAAEAEGAERPANRRRRRGRRGRGRGRGEQGEEEDATPAAEAEGESDETGPDDGDRKSVV